MSLLPDFIEHNDQTRAREEHLNELRALVGNVYPNKFERSHITGDEDTITALVEKFADRVPKLSEGERPAPEALERINAELKEVGQLRTSGRIATPPRVMGKAAFVHLSDGQERLQIYVRKQDAQAISNDTGQPVDDFDSGWKVLQLLDHGDFIGVEGNLFVTKTGELSIHVQKIQFLSKALLPMPDKMHGLTDPEIRQRQRYVDLIASSLKVEKPDEGEKAEKADEGNTASRELSSREVFLRRSRLIREMRRYLDDHGYIEVETPMLSPKATGAAAKPFETYHNTLDIKLYARIAPELYLKRLLVGGFERVYELNRNFRNEGISTRHNPEFTMLEFYTAYKDVNWMMDFCEEMIRQSVIKATGEPTAIFSDAEIDFGRRFQRLTMKEAIAEYWPKDIKKLGKDEISTSAFDDPVQIERAHWFLHELEKVENEATERQRNFALEDYRQNKYSLGNARFALSKTEEEYLAIQPYKHIREHVRESSKDMLWEKAQKRATSRWNEGTPSDEQTARQIVEMFERLAESNLVQPTFITDFPKPVSPLSKASPDDPTVAERFELYIVGMEVANGFSELNDPVEQYERFRDQVEQRERGDEEAMVMDEDYIRALAYGMPPAAGIGIGIDRLAMLLTNRQSIRDVILFPHMRPQRKAEEKTDDEQDENK